MSNKRHHAQNGVDLFAFQSDTAAKEAAGGVSVPSAGFVLQPSLGRNDSNTGRTEGHGKRDTATADPVEHDQIRNHVFAACRTGEEANLIQAHVT